jgi:hypothetical protein
LPLLRSLDISRTRIELAAFEIVRTERPGDKARPQVPRLAWASLTRLVLHTVSDAQDLRHLPTSLVELEIRRVGVLYDTLVDLILGNLDAVTSLTRLLPSATRHLILSRKCFSATAKPTTATTASSSLRGRDAVTRGRELRYKLEQSSTLINGITLTFV